MAIAFVFESDEIQQEEYDGLMEALGRADIQSELPPGAIAHVAGPKGAGWRAIDLWENEDSARRYYESESFRSVVGQSPKIATQPWPIHRIEVAKTISTID